MTRVHAWAVALGSVGLSLAGLRVGDKVRFDARSVDAALVVTRIEKVAQ